MTAVLIAPDQPDVSPPPLRSPLPEESGRPGRVPGRPDGAPGSKPSGSTPPTPEARFDALVASLEGLAVVRPEAYRLRLLGLAALGYGYIALVLALLASAAIALVASTLRGETDGLTPLAAILRFGVLVLALPVLLTIWFALRGLFWRDEPPQGLVLTREQTPRLFAFLDEVRTAAAAPPIHGVVLHDEFNASMVQQARYGPFGGYRNYLVLGLPIMDSLAADEFRGVLAHEVGHLTAVNDRLIKLVCELRCTWTIILCGIEQSHWLARLAFLPFFNWYVPYFAAYSSVLARQQELGADQLAARLVGGRAMADGLVRSRLVGNHLDATFWSDLWDAPKTVSETPRTLFSDIAERAQTALPYAEQQNRLTDALAEKTESLDTHPCLRERLAALEQEPRVPEQFTLSAAEDLLGEALPALREVLNETWNAEADAWWQDEVKEARERESELAELETTAAARPLTTGERWRQVVLTDQIHGAETCVPLLREQLERQPHSAQARYHLGRLLLKLNEDEGLELLQEAVRIDPGLAHCARHQLEEYLRESERPNDRAICLSWVKHVEERVDADPCAIYQAQADRDYLPHDLTPDELEPIIDVLDELKPVKEAYLVRFTWPGFPESQVYWLELLRDRDFKDDGVPYFALVEVLYYRPDVPGKLVIHANTGKDREHLAAIMGVEGALIFDRATRPVPASPDADTPPAASESPDAPPAPLVASESQQAA
jgi:Zn-dependent protease with chaperone function